MCVLSVIHYSKLFKQTVKAYSSAITCFLLYIQKNGDEWLILLQRNRLLWIINALLTLCFQQSNQNISETLLYWEKGLIVLPFAFLLASLLWAPGRGQKHLHHDLKSKLSTTLVLLRITLALLKWPEGLGKKEFRSSLGASTECT